MNATKLAAKQKEIRDLEREMKEEKSAYEEARQIKAKKLFGLTREVAIVSSGLDEEAVALGLSVLELRGTYARGGDDRASVVQDAITFFIYGPSGQNDMRTRFFGTKSYAHWHGQRSDHEYGYGPKHGDVIFSIGLKREYREKPLTPEQVDACVYVVTCIEAVQDAEARAAA